MTSQFVHYVLPKYLKSQNVPIRLFDSPISRDRFCPLNLSVFNKALVNIDIVNPESCQNYIDDILVKNDAAVAFGGYLEKRNLYEDKSAFSRQGSIRNVHLGIDFWTSAGTEISTPIDGMVHSFQNNSAVGDYGPTIILQHTIEGFIFHTLYGHLSLESIDKIYVGKEFAKGSVLATLGTTAINVNYAPHLHFQIIIDMEGMKGDYPGVCSEDRLDFYQKNCPDPNILLQIY